jgi:putative glutamine amidotransferase
MAGAPSPCVWVVASHRELGNEHGHPQCYTVMDEAGSRTLLDLGLQPVCYPRVPAERLEAMLETVDGLLLGGSATNVHPALYGETPVRPDFVFDADRDALALPLIRLALRKRVPVIAFCRGSHEFNVALGGSLHQWLPGLGGSVRHWEDPDEPLDAQYAERHEVECTPGGELERITGERRFRVSSLHSQGLKRLGEGMVAEARADDGLVEASRWHDASLFAWAFQFHPEWGHRRHPCYQRIMAAYVAAVHAKAAERASA